MRTALIAAISVACMLVPVLTIRAQEAASDDKPYKMLVTDADAVQLADVVKAHVYKSPPVGDTMQVLDRRKGQLVTLKPEKVLVDGTGNVVVLKDGYLAISVTSSEIVADESKQPDQYVLWFVVRKEKKTERVVSYGVENTSTSIEELWAVKDVIIRSVNGETMYTWSEDADGNLVPTLTLPSKP